MITPMDQLLVACPRCHTPAQRVISSRSAFRPDASWVADCTVPFDPEDTRPEVRAYLANPSDRNALARAMRAAGIRHQDHGEEEQAKRARSAMMNMEPLRRETIERFKARHGR
jgi:hypothetical protein